MIAGALEIQLLANMARLRQDMEQAKNVVTKTMSGIEKSVDMAKKALGLFGVGLTANYFANFVKGAINAQDQLDELSQRTGISVEMLAGLDHASKMTGTSLEAMTKGLRSASAQLFEASRGGSTAISIFDELGISVTDTTGALKSSDAVLIEVANRFAVMTNETEKSALAQKLFGKSGAELIPLLNEGGEAIAAMVAEGQRLNPVTAESAALAGQFNDNLDRLRAIVAGAGVSIANNFMPQLIRISEWATAFLQRNAFYDSFESIRLATREWVGESQSLLKILDQAFADLFANASTGGVGAADVLQWAFGQSLINIRSFLQIATVEVASYLDKVKVNASNITATLAGDALFFLEKLGLGNTDVANSLRETWQAAYAGPGGLQEQIDAIDQARLASIEQFLGGNQREKTALFDLIQANSELRREISETLPVYEARGEASEDAAENAGALSTEIQKYIQELRNEQRSLGMTSREQAMFNAELKALGMGAGPDAIAIVRQLAGENFDLAQSARDAAERLKQQEKAAEDLAQASAEASKQMREDWARARESFGEFFADMVEDGSSAFDSLLKSFKRMLTEMTGQLALSGILKMFGVQVPGGGAGGIAGVLDGAGMAGTIAKTLFSSTFSGVAGSSSFVGPVLPGAAASAGGAAGLGGYASALASNPATWAIAALAIAAKNDFWKDPDNYQRSFAGMLTAPTAGAAGSTFNVSPFASGFKAQGIAHNVDRATAEKYIDVYRDLDASVFELVKKLGGNVSLANATLAGVGMDGRFGTAGTFLGMGGKSTEDDLAAMVNSYLGQFLNHVTGLDEELMNAVRSAGTAEEAIDILSKAVEEHAEVASEAATVAKAQIAVEERLMRERMDGVNALSQELQAVIQMQRTVQMDIYSAMGATPLFGSDTNGQLQALEYQRDLILGNHAAQIKAEEELHKQRIGFAQSLAEYATNVRLGQYSSLGSAGKLDVAQGNFRSLSALAQGGDMDALKRLQGAADQYITAADAMFASSAGRKTIVAEVLGVLDSLSGQLGSAEFDPTAANQALLAQLQALDVQLAQINYGINDAIIAELRNMNLTLADLTPNMQQSLFGAIEQWIETAMPGGEAMLQALGGIKGSVDMLPLGIGNYMSQALGAMMQSMLAAGSSPSYIANRIPVGSITDSAANAYLASNGYGSTGDYRTSDAAIREYVAGYQGAASDIDAIRQIYADAVSSGIGSGQLGNALGYSQQQIYDALRAAGIDPAGFAEGGISSGSRAGHLEMLHGTEAVIPLSGGRGVPVDLRSSVDMQPVVEELQAMRGELESLRKVVFADAQFSGKQRARSNELLESIDSKSGAQSPGVGSGRYGNAA